MFKKNIMFGLLLKGMYKDEFIISLLEYFKRLIVKVWYLD